MKTETQRFTAKDDEGTVYTIIEYEEKFITTNPDGGGSYEFFSLFQTLDGEQLYQVTKTEFRMVKTDKVLKRTTASGSRGRPG